MRYWITAGRTGDDDDLVFAAPSAAAARRKVARHFASRPGPPVLENIDVQEITRVEYLTCMRLYRENLGR